MTHFFESDASWLAFLITYSLKSLLILAAGYLVVMVWKTLAVKEKYRLLGWTLVISAVIPSISFFLPEWNLLPVGLKEPVAGQISSVINMIQLPSATVFASGVSIMAIVQMVWIGGILWNLLRVLIGQIATRRMIRAGIPIEDDTLADLAQSVGVEAPVKLLRSSRTAAPFTFGLMRPVIVVPDRFVSWTGSQRSMVLLHELAHIARKDASVHTLLMVLNSVYWFNPVVWLVLSRIRQLSEETCDEMVISGGIKPSDYADHLLHVLQSIKKKKIWGLSGATMTTKSFKHMGGRIMKILTDKPIHSRPQPIRIAWIVTMMICAVLALGSFQTEAGDKPVPPKTDDTKLPDKSGEELPSSDDFVKLTKTPEMITETTPIYPKKAKEKGTEGEVWVKALILKDGSVHEALIAKSSGSKLLDNSALKAGLKNRYKPGYQGEKPVACWVTYKVSFILKTDKK